MSEQQQLFEVADSCLHFNGDGKENGERTYCRLPKGHDGQHEGYYYGDPSFSHVTWGRSTADLIADLTERLSAAEARAEKAEEERDEWRDTAFTWQKAVAIAAEALKRAREVGDGD